MSVTVPAVNLLKCDRCGAVATVQVDLLSSLPMQPREALCSDCHLVWRKETGL